MKKNSFLTLTIAIAIASVLVLTQSCEKDLNEEINFESYAFTDLDADGGTWKPVLLTSGDQISVSPPPALTSTEYLQEVEDLKETMNQATSEQKDAIKYWGTNTLLRWNQIANDLAAKYNLPAAPNPDGTYPVHDAANPSAYPNFPFAMPPYTCRMFAYWGGAQFDALITVWNQKYQYNCPAPYKTDASITPVLPENDLPSYPSEDAAIAAVSELILSAMFPLEKDFIKQKADELKNTRLWAGTNLAMDIAAGDSIGRAVAAIYIDRSKTDGMKTAGMTKPVADSLENAAQAMWGWHWENLDVPQRPVGILPKFGKVKLWFVPSVETVRPGPPPAPGSAEFNENATELRGYDDDLSNEKRDIALFWNDGPGTYTPPGHWNRIAYDYIENGKLNPLRTARVFAYLNMAVMDAGVSCWDAKYYYHYPRPSGAIPGLKTNIGIPNFPSYTSGHSTFSAAGAEVLSYFFPEGRTEFECLAKEASESRIYSRIHFRFDCETGLTVGKTIGTYAVDVAELDGAD